MVDDAAREFAAKVWDRVLRDEAFRVAASRELLVCVVDGDGLESAWVERAPSAESSHESSRQGDEHRLNFRKHVSKHIAQANAVTAAMAFWATYRGFVGQIDWLVVIAADATGDAGYLARVQQGADGLQIVGPRSDWPARRRCRSGPLFNRVGSSERRNDGLNPPRP
jgi:hypothetical protein